MQISLPREAELLANSQAAAAGFTSIDEYLASLILRQPNGESSTTRETAFHELQKLRKELPKLGAAEIVRTVHEARTLTDHALAGDLRSSRWGRSDCA